MRMEWARKVLTAAGNEGGALRLDGQLVDAPVLQSARQVLAHENQQDILPQIPKGATQAVSRP
jgi:citrate lyase beta subunit